DAVRIGAIEVEAVSSYNIGKVFHPKENNWLGFVVTVMGKRIYYCGDTDLIPEMESISADIVIAPVGGTYTMNAEEAARAVNMIKPEAAIPIHYGDIVGSVEDAERFRDLCEVPVDIKQT
ncbi:MAG: MBL fold metallo-hydrolase, partial [Syntrophobacterales bacterium]|nr:MBL fold metallo-hydrolase [Syntrophobacterales bacterium]